MMASMASASCMLWMCPSTVAERPRRARARGSRSPDGTTEAAVRRGTSATRFMIFAEVTRMRRFPSEETISLECFCSCSCDQSARIERQRCFLPWRGKGEGRRTDIVPEAAADAREVVPDEVDANVVDRLDGIGDIPD